VSLPSFTIVTPCLNGAATLEQALESVREQDYAGEVEHVVVDGGSTDGTLEILDAARVRYISEPDRGLSDAVNKGIRMARGDVVGWLNADDVYLPGALARAGKAFAERDETLWVTGPCLIIGADGEEIRPAVTRYKNFFLRRWSYPLHLVQNFVSCPSTFVRRDAFDRVGLLDERFKYSMDYDLWLRALAETRNMVRVPEVLAFYRWHGEGQISSLKWRQVIEACEVRRDFASRHPHLVADLSAHQLGELLNGPLLRSAYAAYWKRDLVSAQRLFRVAARRGAWRARDAKFVLSSLLPGVLYRGLIAAADRR